MFKALIVKTELVCLKNMPVEWTEDTSVLSAICSFTKLSIIHSTILNLNTFLILSSILAKLASKLLILVRL